MLGYLFTAAIGIWVLSRSRLWKFFLNVRREIRVAVRRNSFAQYYVAIRIRELVGLAGFLLAGLYVFLSDEVSYSTMHTWARVLLLAIFAVIALYVLFLVVDSRRLRRRFNRLVNSYRNTRRRADNRPPSVRMAGRR